MNKDLNIEFIMFRGLIGWGVGGDYIEGICK